MNTKVLKTGKVFRRIRNCESGSALVETALTFPVLVMLIAGATEFSRVAYASLEVVSAAKAGVSYGAQTGATTTDLNGITYAAQHDAGNVTSIQVLSANSTYVCSDGSASTGANTDCSTSHMEQTLTVTTQATIDPIIHIPGLPTTYTINGQASQLCLQ
ncbi:TadE/TadG family type IV pilus assembly protein [Telmatobacter sp. DSM 110680]|uniref:TadE/TadG family type IV pilus assembly protein n=1 Tax=Telmatobacter sp. DSM 110680 TaxID=3036704 RepID=A0AAU7DIP0_9BACT